MFGRSTSNFDRLLEKATSQLLLEPDWTSIMMICDSIRQNDTNPKYAVTAIKKKFYNTNPHVALYALQVMESAVKNCGVLVHDEIATKQFMEELRDLVKQSTDENIKTKVLELLQTWGMAFRNSPKYRIVTETLKLMKAEGWKFAPVREAEAMFEADTAPEWAEGDVCNRCRVQFSTFTRQHHCRACGQVFCGKCSAKSCVLPKFGIEREVRVCDSCYDQYGPAEGEQPITKQITSPVTEQATAGKTSKGDLPAEYLSSPLSKQSQEPQAKKPSDGKTEAELKEEEELALVLALSKSEAEEQEKKKKKTTSELMAAYSNGTGGQAVGKTPEAVQDPELEKYLNREYWESQSRAGGEQLGQGVGVAKGQVLGVEQERVQGSPPGQQGGADSEELDEFTASLRTQLEIFVNRMKSNSSRGRPIANDSSVQTLFMNVMTMHGKLVHHIQEQEDSRVRYEGLQDKLAQVKDARAALDALREEEADRKRKVLEELERQRQVQLAAKLDVMRKKKAEYLEYQRQVALQRMADQEREVAKKAEASKAAYMQQQQGMYNMYLPYGYQQPGMLPPGQQPGMLPPGMSPQVPSGSHQPSLGMGQVHPGMMQQQPQQHQPGGPQEQPGMVQQPGIPQQQPGMPPPQQGMPQQQPGMPPQTVVVPQSGQQPIMSQPQGQQPVMTQHSGPQPIMSQQPHMMTQQPGQSPMMPQQPGQQPMMAQQPPFSGYPYSQAGSVMAPQDQGPPSNFNMAGMAAALPSTQHQQFQPQPPPPGALPDPPQHQPGAPDQSLISFD